MYILIYIIFLKLHSHGVRYFVNTLQVDIEVEPIFFKVVHNFSAFIRDNTIPYDILRGNCNTTVIL